jgi:hypothetical protein
MMVDIFLYQFYFNPFRYRVNNNEYLIVIIHNYKTHFNLLISEVGSDLADVIATVAESIKIFYHDRTSS